MDKIQSFWIGNELSTLEQLSIISFLKNGHDYDLYSYENNINGLPQNVNLVDANLIIPYADFLEMKQKLTLANISDIFRYKMLYENGGWWVDTDIVCLNNFNKIESSIMISTSWEYQWGECANNCVLRFDKKNIIAKILYERSVEIAKSIQNYCDTGPFLVQSIVNEFELQDKLIPYFYFNPISWRHVPYSIAYNNRSLKNYIKELLRPYFKFHTLKGMTYKSNSYAIHLWNNVWSENNLDKNETYAKSSIYEILKSKYL